LKSAAIVRQSGFTEGLAHKIDLLLRKGAGPENKGNSETSIAFPKPGALADGAHLASERIWG